MKNDERSEMGVIRNQLVCSAGFTSKPDVHWNTLVPVSWNSAGHCENLPSMHPYSLNLSLNFLSPVWGAQNPASLPSPPWPSPPPISVKKKISSFILSGTCFLGLANLIW